MDKSETWDACAEDYVNNTQKVTTQCVVKLLEELSVFPVTSSASPIKVIDIAAGPGTLGILLGEAYSQAGQLDKITILSTDFSKMMIEQAQDHINSRSWSSTQFSTCVADATNLVNIPSDFYTHAFCTFGLMMIPNPAKALSEMFRVLQSAGTVGVTTWQKIAWHPIVTECVSRARKACPSNDQNATSTDDVLYTWSDTACVQQVLENAGFENVKISIFETCWSFADQNQCVQQITKAKWFQPVIENFNLTKEQREKYNELAPQVVLDMIGNNPNQSFDFPIIAILAYGQKPTH